MRGLIAFVSFAIFLSATSSAQAFCSEPSMYAAVPDAPSTISKPSAPFCMSGYSYSRTHTCDEWEIRSYLDEIDGYVRKLRAYAEASAEFANQAASFASDALDYAKCEQADVMSEIE